MATPLKSSVQVRIDDTLKKNAESVLNNLGLDTPTAIRMFFKKIVATRSIPFRVEEVSPYQFTKEEEAEMIQAYQESFDPEQLEGPYDSAKEAIAHLHSSIK